MQRSTGIELHKTIRRSAIFGQQVTSFFPMSINDRRRHGGMAQKKIKPQKTFAALDDLDQNATGTIPTASRVSQAGLI
jgi:hypothetical protein